MSEQLDVVAFIQNQILFKQLLKLQLTSLERYFFNRSKNFTLYDGSQSSAPESEAALQGKDRELDNMR